MSENSAVHREAFWVLCDQRLDWGMSRSVWSSKVLPDCVIKVEDSSAHFQNVIEWETWNSVEGSKWARWFAPCRWISPNGTVLVMAKTLPAQPKQFPERIPLFLTDTKKSNYGIHEGRLVCHDYGTNLLMEHGKTDRLKKAEWYER